MVGTAERDNARMQSGEAHVCLFRDGKVRYEGNASDDENDGRRRKRMMVLRRDETRVVMARGSDHQRPAGKTQTAKNG